MSFNKKPVEIVNALMARRTVMLSGEITSDSVEELMEQMMILQNESSEPITLLINSNGGWTIYALQLCDFIEHVLLAPVHGVVVGECSSSATFVLLHCKTRVATINSWFVIHSTKLSDQVKITGYGSAETVAQMLADVKRLEDQVTEMYMRKLKMSRKQVRKLADRGDQAYDSEMYAAEALQIGLIEEIVQGKLQIFK